MPDVWRTLVDTASNLQGYFIVIAVFLIAERLFPAERGQPLRRLWFNLSYTVLLSFALPFILALPTLLATTITSTHPSLVLVDLNRLATGIPLVDWPLRVVVLPFLPILTFDFFYYWHHRLQHRLPFLWRQHKLHHLEQTLGVLTNYRHHWLEEPLRVFTITIPMTLLLSLTPVQSAVAAFLISQWSFVIHANVRLPFGPLTPVVAGPQLHRIHHSSQPEHQNRNYAAFFPFWDMVFRTYHRPQRGEWPKTGVEGEPDARTLWEAAVLPFRRRRRLS